MIPFHGETAWANFAAVKPQAETTIKLAVNRSPLPVKVSIVRRKTSKPSCFRRYG